MPVVRGSKNLRSDANSKATRDQRIVNTTESGNLVGITHDITQAIASNTPLQSHIHWRTAIACTSTLSLIHTNTFAFVQIGQVVVDYSLFLSLGAIVHPHSKRILRYIARSVSAIMLSSSSSSSSFSSVFSSQYFDCVYV